MWLLFVLLRSSCTTVEILCSTMYRVVGVNVSNGANKRGERERVGVG